MPAIVPRLVQHFGLTPRGAQILVELSAGRTVTEIATRMHVARPTVEWHISQLSAHLGGLRQAQLALFLYRRGAILTPAGPWPTFTAKERTVLQGVADGLTNAELGQLLGVSMSTARARVGNAARTVRRARPDVACANRAQLALAAYFAGAAR